MNSDQDKQKPQAPQTDKPVAGEDTGGVPPAPKPAEPTTPTTTPTADVPAAPGAGTPASDEPEKPEGGETSGAGSTPAA